MISIVIASRNEKRVELLKNNIVQTIGNVEYEIIIEWNDQGRGLCEVYNKGASKAVYDYLIFAHDDIYFHTNDWGQILIENFGLDLEIGAVGLAGAAFKSKLLSGWASISDRGIYKNIISPTANGIVHSVRSDQVDYVSYFDSNCTGEQINAFMPLKGIREVVCLDGFFIAVRKNVWKEILFDEFNFRGFHCYDIDFTLSVSKLYKCVVTYDLIVQHFSYGSFDKNWLSATLKLQDKWGESLPHFTNSFTPVDFSSFEFASLKSLLGYVGKINCLSFEISSQILKAEFIKHLGLFMWARLVVYYLSIMAFLKVKMITKKILYKLSINPATLKKQLKLYTTV